MPDPFSKNRTAILLIILKRIPLTIQIQPLTTKVTNPNEIMLTNRTNILPHFNRDLHLSITTIPKPRCNMKPLNILLNTRMVQLIPRGAKYSNPLPQHPDNVACVPIALVEPTLKTITHITITPLTTPTTPIPSQNKPQNMKMRTPIPTLLQIITKTMKNKTTTNNTKTLQYFSHLTTQSLQINTVIFHWNRRNNMLNQPKPLRRLSQTRLNPTSLTNRPPTLVANWARRFTTTETNPTHKDLPRIIHTVKTCLIMQIHPQTPSHTSIPTTSFVSNLTIANQLIITKSSPPIR